MAKKLTKKEMRDAIREAYRKFGKDYHGSVQKSIQEEYGETPSWQQCIGVRNRITPAEWRRWDEERNQSPVRNPKMKVTREEIGDEIVETYTPTYEDHLNAPDDADVLNGKSIVEIATDKDKGLKPRTPALVKEDSEIIFLLNACVDQAKLRRLLTASDLRRLGEMVWCAEPTDGIGFDDELGRFGFVNVNGTVRPVNSL